MGIVNIGTQNHTEVVFIDECKFGAHHRYEIKSVPLEREGRINLVVENYAQIKFQKGPIKKHGVNGCHNEDLIAIVIHRLTHLNQGKSEAIYHLKQALACLKR